MADLVASSTAIFEKAASRFILDDWYMKEYEGQSFYHFLSHETEQRWQLAHYFVAALDRESSQKSALGDLTSFLEEVAEDDILLGSYLEDTEALLQQTLKPDVLKIVTEMFTIYREVVKIFRSELSKDQQQAAVLMWTKNHEYLSDWAWTLD